MRDFQELTRYCALTDMGSHGPMFTWCNKREGDLICKKLDWVLINDVALHGLGRAYSVFEPGGCSDHLRCRIHFDIENKQKKRKPFKFTNVIAMDEFLPTVEEYWRETDQLFHSTSALYRLGKKLKGLKPALRSLSKDKLGQLHKQTKEALLLLCDRHGETLMNPSSEAMRRECEALEKWQKLADIEEEVFKQKSKMHWLEAGDRNNKFFHNAAKIREVMNAIREEVVCPDGSIVTTEEDIKKEAERFFAEMLTHRPLDYEMPNVESLQDLLQFRCSEEDCENLIRDVSAEEVKEVIFKMPSNKSPGPDGYTVEFFKAAWPIIGNDVVVAVQSFFIKGFLPKDDIMVFTDGQKRSVEGILKVFEKFEKLSGLKISLEKSTLYMAGISANNQNAILENFPFEAGQLPVRYLGLPLLTKKMTVADYLSLMEKVRTRMCDWNGRFLSYVGRLQLIKSVIMSLTNFSLSAFRLPRQCLSGIEKLCAGFLWSGPGLNMKKSKVGWAENSLWVKWVQQYLIRKGSFWSIKETTTVGSWMWKKILKTRDSARRFHRMEVKNGETTSFWYDHWCNMGRLRDLLGARGFMDLGIPGNSTVAEAIQKHRRRRHRVVILNRVEEEIEKIKSANNGA
ncbi:uncharacterized protein LOC125602576 [Brassica napus]|uniref:uncharacterized protein LOC125602576 n=1 Tax=Brassica napus TaxID=3708 RepID=UPI002078BDD3|nr:uncharacterized protein LOC125602576 [Brassica napus]